MYNKVRGSLPIGYKIAGARYERGAGVGRGAVNVGIILPVLCLTFRFEVQVHDAAQLEVLCLVAHHGRIQPLLRGDQGAALRQVLVPAKSRVSTAVHVRASTNRMRCILNRSLKL